MTWPQGMLWQPWYDAVSRDPGIRKAALGYWARHLDELPGPIFFALTQQQLLSGEWQRIVRASEQRCPCGERRWLIPQHSQPFFEPPDATPVEVSASHQLAIGPWGGDTLAAMLQLSVGKEALQMHLMPYSNLTREQLAQLGLGVFNITGAREGALVGSAMPVTIEPIPLDSIEQQLDERKIPLAVKAGIRVGPPTSADVFLFRPFAVSQIDRTASTVKVIVSANCSIVDRADRANVHICQ